MTYAGSIYGGDDTTPGDDEIIAIFDDDSAGSVVDLPVSTLSFTSRTWTQPSSTEWAAKPQMQKSPQLRTGK